MNELDIFRGFRSRVAEPSTAAELNASARLSEAIDGHRGMASRLQGRTPRRFARAALATALVAGVAATVLFVEAPWKSSPGFLERAEAALTLPEGTILHARWEIRRTSREFGCSVTGGTNELWADLRGSDRYRVIEREWPSPEAADRRSMACEGHMTREIGGTPDGSLRFDPPNTLWWNGPGWVAPKDTVAYLRDALAEGQAHDEGQAKLDGRDVKRIRIDCSRPSCEDGPDYWYVDPETFMPVQFEWPNAMHFNDRFGFLDFDVVGRYLTYEYLPRTEANLALTDIRAQHPKATQR